MISSGHVDSIGRPFVLLVLGASLFCCPIKMDLFKRFTDTRLKMFYKYAALRLAVFANVSAVIVPSTAEAVFDVPFPVNPTSSF